jgi:hypothetical protein
MLYNRECLYTHFRERDVRMVLYQCLAVYMSVCDMLGQLLTIRWLPYVSFFGPYLYALSTDRQL